MILWGVQKWILTFWKGSKIGARGPVWGGPKVDLRFGGVRFGGDLEYLAPFQIIKELAIQYQLINGPLPRLNGVRNPLNKHEPNYNFLQKGYNPTQVGCLIL